VYRPQIQAAMGAHKYGQEPALPLEHLKCYRFKKIHLRSQFERPTGFGSEPFWPWLIICPPLGKTLLAPMQAAQLDVTGDGGSRAISAVAFLAGGGFMTFHTTRPNSSATNLETTV